MLRRCGLGLAAPCDPLEHSSFLSGSFNQVKAAELISLGLSGELEHAEESYVVLQHGNNHWLLTKQGDVASNSEWLLVCEQSGCVYLAFR